MAQDSYDAIWQEAWNRIKTYENIDPAQIDAFFSRLQPQAFSPGFMMMTTDNEWLKHWVETTYVALIARALEEIHGVPFAVEIAYNPYDQKPQPLPPSETQEPPTTKENKPLTQPVSSPLPDEPSSQKATNKQVEPDVSSVSQNFLSTYTFDNFVVGASNNIPYSIAVAVAEEPGQQKFNPFFVYGKSGLGKTHLLCAIKNYISTTNPAARTLYVEAGELVADYTDASINSKNNPNSYADFYAHYETADVLLIDDVQNLQGKEGTLNVLFEILNKMITGGRQVVLSADRPPRSINFNERILSRMNQGFPIDIQPPETETKIAIVRNFISEYKAQYPDEIFDISPEIQDYIAQVSGSNIRELKSAVTVVIINAIKTGPLSTQDVASILQDHFSSGITKKTTISDIQKATEQYYGISHEELVGKRRNAHIVRARHIAMYLCRTLIDVPFQSIGDAFGGMHHTTVMTAYNNIIEQAKDDIDIIGDIENLKQQINEL